MRSAIHKLVWSRDGGFGIDADLLQFRRRDFDGLTSLLGSPGTWLGEREQSLAAALQTVTEEIFLSLARYIHHCRPADALCIAGGVGLNCQANWVAGVGLGIDRAIAVMCGKKKIREVMAFPKTKQGYCPVAFRG